MKTDGAQCPAGWSLFEESCYIVVNQPDTWFEAEIMCEALHGNLVTIETPDENNFTATLMLRAAVTQAWIGLVDVVVENEFVWTTNEEIPEYTNWSTGQPDNAGMNEDCVELRTDWANRWNDNNCHVLLNYACERPSEASGIIG